MECGDGIVVCVAGAVVDEGVREGCFEGFGGGGGAGREGEGEFEEVECCAGVAGGGAGKVGYEGWGEKGGDFGWEFGGEGAVEDGFEGGERELAEGEGAAAGKEGGLYLEGRISRNVRGAVESRGERWISTLL